MLFQRACHFKIVRCQLTLKEQKQKKSFRFFSFYWPQQFAFRTPCTLLSSEGLIDIDGFTLQCVVYACFYAASIEIDCTLDKNVKDKKREESKTKNLCLLFNRKRFYIFCIPSLGTYLRSFLCFDITRCMVVGPQICELKCS